MFDQQHLPERGGEFASALGKISPPVAVSAGAVAGISLEQWVLIATLIYTVLQSAYLIWKFLRERRADRPKEPVQ